MQVPSWKSFNNKCSKSGHKSEPWFHLKSLSSRKAYVQVVFTSEIFSPQHRQVTSGGAFDLFFDWIKMGMAQT